MGEQMVYCGTQIFKVEQNLTRMGGYYGAKSTNVFAINSSIVLTVDFGELGQFTETRRLNGSVSTDFARMEKYNALCRKCAEKIIPISELKSEIDAIASVKGRFKFYIGSAVAAGAFTVFFGGKAQDALIAAAVALFICFSQRCFMPICPNSIIFNFFTSFAAGTAICLFCTVFGSFSYEKIIMGDLMLLIPGIAITNALRDVFVGDTVSGSMRFVESIFWTIGLAAGFMISIFITGVPV